MKKFENIIFILDYRRIYMSDYILYRKDYLLLDSAVEGLDEFIKQDNIGIISQGITLSKVNMYILTIVFKSIM